MRVLVPNPICWRNRTQEIFVFPLKVYGDDQASTHQLNQLINSEISTYYALAQSLNLSLLPIEVRIAVSLFLTNQTENLSNLISINEYKEKVESDSKVLALLKGAEDLFQLAFPHMIHPSPTLERLDFTSCLPTNLFEESPMTPGLDSLENKVHQEEPSCMESTSEADQK